MVKKQDNKQEKRITPSTIAVIGSVIILIGGFFLSYNYIQSKRIIAYDYMANVFYQEQDVELLEYDGELKEEEKEEDLGEVTNNYIGYLTIPKINLKKGFLDMRSELNNVEQNVTVIEGSSYPTKDKGNLILAAHSGTGWKAFFNDLYKLSTGDTAEISYKGKIYTYKIVNIYKQEKTGKVAIYRNYNKTTLTLVTCTNFDKATQTIYVAELQNVEEE